MMPLPWVAGSPLAWRLDLQPRGSTWDSGVTANKAAWPVLRKRGHAVDAVEAGGRASESEPFVWSREIDVVLLRPLLTYWFNLAQMLADHPEHQPPGSIEARVFYRNLVAAILADLVRQAPEEFAALQERWPPL